MKTKLQILFLSILPFLLISCKDDITETIANSSEGNLLISTMLPNADGMSGSSYIQLMDNLDSKSMTNTSALPVPYASVVCLNGDDVFVAPGWGGDSDVLTKYTRSGGALVKQGEYVLPSSAAATSVIVNGNYAYISCSMLGKIIVINHTTMEKVTEIDLSAFGVGDQNPDPSAMILRDNLLFVALSQMVGGYYPDPARPYSDVAIIDITTNQVVKMITEKTSGMSTPTRPADPYSIFMDEDKNIYIVCIGAFGALPGHNSGILRIKAGETEFDESYKFVFNSTSISGETNLLDYVHAVKYAGNNKLYGTANIPAYYGNPVNFIADRTVCPVEIDLSAKTITKLGLPYSNSYGVSVGIYNNQIIFGLATTSANGYYLYNPSTKEAGSSAVITTEGYPYSINTFN